MVISTSEKLLQTLHELDQDKLNLTMLEVCSSLLTMLHWQRGIIDMLIATKTVHLEGEWLDNWNRVIANLETYEVFLWEILPGRNLIPIMRHYRQTGELLDGWENLLQKDNFGRLKYDATNVDDIEELLRKVKDVRQFEASKTR